MRTACDSRSSLFLLNFPHANLLMRTGVRPFDKEQQRERRGDNGLSRVDARLAALAGSQERAVGLLHPDQFFAAFAVPVELADEAA